MGKRGIISNTVAHAFERGSRGRLRNRTKEDRGGEGEKKAQTRRQYSTAVRYSCYAIEATVSHLRGAACPVELFIERPVQESLQRSYATSTYCSMGHVRRNM